MGGRQKPEGDRQETGDRRLSAVTRSQAMAFGATKRESEEELPGFTWPQTVLVSRECCHVTRTGPTATTAGFVLFSNGLGLKKWVMSCFSSSLNSVACGVKSVKATPVPEGRQT